MDSSSVQLAKFATNLHFDDIPEHVVARVLWLFLDWYASAVAGSSSRSSAVMRNFAETMGPAKGPCQVIGHPLTTSPYFAALINGSSSHVVEQDDLHNSSILHPATVVFPPIFAVAQANPHLSGKDFITAATVGYECGIRTGEFLGKSHYRVFHMTATAGTIASSLATGKLLNLDSDKMLHTLGSAGTQAGGLWEFLKDGADSKQLHTAKASADGLLAAYCAEQGLTAASQILEGKQGMSAGMLGEGNEARLTDGLMTRWALTETSFKYHASCRHTHPAADALLALCDQYDISSGNIKSIKAFVYQAASDVLGAVDVPENIHQSKFSMGFVLALIAKFRKAGVTEFSLEALDDVEIAELRGKVEMMVDKKIDNAYPDKWGSRVEVEMMSGESYVKFVDSPKGDPDNMLSRQELEDKAIRLADYSHHFDEKSMLGIIESVWGLESVSSFCREFV